MTTDIKQLRGTERLIRLDCLFDGNPGCVCSHCEASGTIARLAAERDRLKAELNDNSTLAHWAGWKVRALKAEAERDRLAGEAETAKSQFKALQMVTSKEHEDTRAERDSLKAALDEAVKWMDGCAVSGGYPAWHAKARKALGGDAS